MSDTLCDAAPHADGRRLMHSVEICEWVRNHIPSRRYFYRREWISRDSASLQRWRKPWASLCLGPGAHYALAGVGAEVEDFGQVLRKYLSRN